MAFGDSAILDDFNRIDEGPPLSANWTKSGHVTNGLHVVSNEAQAETQSVGCQEYWNVEAFGPACEAYVTYSDIGSNAVCGVLLRLVDQDSANTDGYFAGAETFGGGQIKIKRLDNGTFTQLGSTISQAMADGDKIGLECDGNSIDAYFDDGGAGWALAGERTDGTYSSAGYAALELYTTSTLSALNADDFGAGTLAAATGLSVNISPDANYIQIV